MRRQWWSLVPRAILGGVLVGLGLLLLLWALSG
jgi:hypothetical protein